MSKLNSLWGIVTLVLGVELCLASSVDFGLLNLSNKRLIEPTSPILGHEISNFMKTSKLSPKEIYIQISQRYQLDYDIKISTYAYFKTLKPELDKYCSSLNFMTLNRSELTEVEHAAIPLEVLTPLHLPYLQNYNQSLSFNYFDLQRKTEDIANSFQEKRENCGVAIRLRQIENKLEKFCLNLKFCTNSKKINSIPPGFRKDGQFYKI
jgi:hypothetical protein